MVARQSALPEHDPVQIVEWDTREGKAKGRATKIDEDGALVISNKKTIRILAGDIVHLKS